MNGRQPTDRAGRTRTRIALTVVIVVAIAAMLAWWRIRRTDRQLRDDLLVHARLAAQSIDAERVESLAGTEADLGTPAYLRLKEHLARVRQCNRQCRFLYLMGQHPDGAIFFYVDSQPVGGKDEAPAGLVYEEAPARLHAVFATWEEDTEGPYTDRWGTLVSAFVPMQDPAAGGNTGVVLGMDVDASKWRAIVASECALPVSLLVIVALVGSLCALLVVTNRNIRESRETIRKNSEMQRVAAGISADFVDISNLDSRIADALQTIGDAIGVGRAHVFQVREDGVTLDAAYEWCADGVPAQIDALQGIKADEMLPWFWPRVRNGEVVHVPAVADLPHEAGAEKALWENLGVQSLLAVPMAADNRFWGFLCFCCVRSPRSWSEAGIALLRMTGETMGRAIERRDAQVALHRSEMRLRALSDATFEAIFLSEKGVCLEQNSTAGEMFGYTDEEAIGRMGTEWIAPEDRDRVMKHMLEGREQPYEVTALRKDGSTFPSQIQARMIEYRGRSVRVTALRDITARRQAEEEKDKLQKQLLQAQKMEAIGNLAGGIAHDFNNLLMGILNYVDLCRDALPADHAARSYLDEIATDAKRSTNLTRQLLAFARKQTIAPRTMDLNDAVSGMLKMLRRLIGEDIDLTWTPGDDLWPVVMDPSQVDQLLANLTVNARDAITDGGRIVIATENTTLDEAFCTEHPEATPGEYVLLSVVDNGCGMDAEVRSRIFDPFFTTKGVGNGTGLGLATVYGIMKQNGGYVDVSSQPGKGTTFRIYLPRGTAAARETPRQRPERPQGTETVLLVEDEKSLRRTIRAFLRQLGYTVLTAADPAEALALAGEHTDAIRLLITDVIMPGMNGRLLAERLRSIAPDIKCLFMSGYPTDVLADRGVLQDGVNFLEKPFSRDALAHKVREVLDG